MRKFKIIYIFLIITAMTMLISTTALAVDDPEIGSDSALLVENNSGQAFYSKNADGRMYPASTTKIMTVMLAVEAVEKGTVTLYDQVTASETAFEGLLIDGSSAGITAGEIMTLEDLLYCAMVASANEACNIIAEYIAGSVSGFVDMMNQRAQEIGCTGTHFANTHGLPDDNHYTTAWDLYRITSEAMSYPLFAEICDTIMYETAETNVSASRTLSNTNALINKDSYYAGYYYEYAHGVKTGRTTDAGYCLVSTAEKDGLSFISVVLGGKETEYDDGRKDYGSFSDSITLYEWVFNNFSYQEILKSTDIIAELPVELASADQTVSVRPQTSIQGLLANDETFAGFEKKIVIYSEQAGQTLQAPINAGEVLGEITVSRDGMVYGTTKLVASTSVDLARMQYIKSEIAKALGSTAVKTGIFVLLAVLALYLAIVIVYRVQRTRYVRSVKRAGRTRTQARSAEPESESSQRGHAPEADPERDFFEDRAEAVVTAEPEGKPVVKEREDGLKMYDAERDYFEEFFKNDK